jgi:hypothetical protein
MRNFCLYLIFTLAFCYTTIGIKSQNTLSLPQCEDSIQNLFVKLIAAKTDSSKTEINNQIIALFNIALADMNSFGYTFEKIKHISKLNSADGLIRIINWNLPFQNGEFQYFGFIQQRDTVKKVLQLYKLIDQSGKIEDPIHAECSEKNWYGALYYKILTTKWKEITYYTLLGWDGNDNFTNKKLIENFYFKGENLVFGPPIFKMDKTIQNRLIFEYSKQSKMMLRYDEKLDIIVWDHLAPSQENFTGQYMYYGPDLSQDGIQFIDGYWVLKPNLDLRNMGKSTGKSIKKSF